MSELSTSLGTKLDKADVVDPGAEAEAGQAADAKGTYEGLNRVLGVASDARVLAESKADKAALDTHVASTSNPHAVTAEQINAYTKDDVETKLAKKADRATTLAGYGITDAATKAEIAAKADLVDGKVPAAQLPSYVDDVLEYDTMSAFPATGESGKIYVAKDTNLVYRWSGTQYVEISPSPAFDNTVTETSQNGVKSSGIWSWVKSLLPRWLTGDYAEPATVASVANKRDMSDLAVYSVTRTENTDWTWTGENAEIVEALNNAHSKPYHANVGDREAWTDIDPFPFDLSRYSSYGIEDADLSATSLWYKLRDMDSYEVITVYAGRTRYMDESIEQKADQQLAAVATDDAAKPADGSLMKYDAANGRLVKATASDAPFSSDGDYVKPEILNSVADIANTAYETASRASADSELALIRIGNLSVAKRDLTDNVCRKTEFTEWICNPPRTEFGGVYSVKYDSEVKVYTLFDNGVGFEEIGSPTDDKLNLEFVGYCTATRSAVCTSNELYTTTGYVDGKVSSAVSTNNPAFVSAVQNTPAPEPGQGEDPPWGTWGTVGAAIAGLVAGLKWLKDKVFDGAGNIQDQFTTDLLGKQVANVKANTVSLAASYSETETYAVGDAVTHDGKLYKCAVAITTAEAWTPAHWTETTVATLWNNADTTSYGGQN